MGRIRYKKKRDADWRPAANILKSYLQSFDWQKTRSRYRLSGLPCECLLCGKKQFQLHHTDYRNLGSEDVSTLRPLCDEHHRELHQLVNRRAYPLRRTDEALYEMSCSVKDAAAFEERMALFSRYPNIPRKRSADKREHEERDEKQRQRDAFTLRRGTDPQAVIDELVEQTTRQGAEIGRLIAENHRLRKGKRVRR